MAKVKTRFECEHCGAVSAVSLGRCPSCQAWDSFAEVRESAGGDTPARSRLGKLSGMAPFGEHAATKLSLSQIAELDAKLTALPEVSDVSKPRTHTGFAELDRVLGGGLVSGSYLLVGGDPGIGKSTLMLQLAATLAHAGHRVLYVAGEESLHQIKGRALRLGFEKAPVTLLPETDMAQILLAVQHTRPDVLIVDSIQSTFDGEVANTPGSVSQVKACAAQLMPVAKTMGITTILVGHVTKDGTVAGPKLLEHLVDTVLYFEGERYKDLRLLRAMKNRFGGAHELGVFQMGTDGLEEVANPSALFLSGFTQSPEPGSIAVCTLEGSRPMVVEIQALAGQTQYPSPRRVANGFPLTRLHQVVAVLERRLGVDLSRHDLFVNVVGGLSIDEPAADLAVALALITSWRDVAIPTGTVVFGEIGLTGEIRAVRAATQRVAEALKIGFQRVILPAANISKDLPDGITAQPVQTLLDALRTCQLSG
ncbi:MAG: DNA repair protein RadA [Vampirovibrionales bacterium]|nr:DNA repair protein RadA [Vampirovibrionales bacterium]